MNTSHPFRKHQPDSEPMMLVNDLSKIFRNEMHEAAESSGVPAGYRSLLHALRKTDGCSQLELCRATRLKAPTVSITLRKMERDGYVTREEDEKDARAMKVHITEKGLAAEDHNLQKLEEIDTIVSGCLSPEEKKQLLELLIRVRKTLCEELGVEAPGPGIPNAKKI